MYTCMYNHMYVYIHTCIWGIGNLKGVDKDIITKDLLKEMNNPDSGGGVGFLPGMSLPLPRRATGMETLVSPRMMRRGR